MPKFYCVIIGTEILQGRRADKHFEFLKSQLANKGLELSGSFVVKDDKKLLKDIFSLMRDKNTYMFSFGGIGSTPDDLTRQIASEVFTNEDLVRHEEAKKLLEESFGELAYPHRIKMADLPKNAKLLTNVVNKAPGFSLEDRLFFMPGFPQMSHPMVIEALDLYVEENSKEIFTYNIRVYTRENDLVGFMESLPSQIELSSLPRIGKDEFSVEILLRCYDKTLLNSWSEKLNSLLNQKAISFTNLKKEENEH